MGTLRSLRLAAVTSGIAALFLLLACNGGSNNPVNASGSANVNLAITDAPSDSWQEVSVVLKSASLIPQGSQTPIQIWPASGATSTTPTVVNLVDLNNVATVLGSVSVPAGTYSTLQLVIDTDPTTMTLVDDGGNTIPASAITVKGNGTIKVALAPAFVVSSSGNTTLQADFNLAHPLSIVETTLGGVTQVVLDLQVRFKALPANASDLQFTRKLGQVTAATATGFTLTDSSGNALTYGVDANTIYWNADTKAAGNFAGITKDLYALVASNLNADGSLFARRVWYGTSATALPTWTPEGLVRRVNPTSNSFTIYSQATTATARRSAWAHQTVKVNAATTWTFNTNVAMGTGTSFLSDIWRGCRVDVVLDSTGTTATSVNVETASDEGFLGAASATGITFGFPSMAAHAPAMAQGVSCGIGDMAPRTWNYYANANDPANAFSWWYFGLPSAKDASAADLMKVVTASQAAKLPVTAYARLYWDVVSGTWQVYQLVLEPERLNTAVISTAYADGGSGSGTMGVTCFNPRFNFAPTSATPMTITLDYSGDLQTVVSSATYTKATNTFTFIVPVPESQWPTLLMPPATGTNSLDQIWVRPVLNGTTIDWHAYTVQQFTWQ